MGTSSGRLFQLTKVFGKRHTSCCLFYNWVQGRTVDRSGRVFWQWLAGLVYTCYWWWSICGGTCRRWESLVLLCLDCRDGQFNAVCIYNSPLKFCSICAGSNKHPSARRPLRSWCAWCCVGPTWRKHTWQTVQQKTCRPVPLLTWHQSSGFTWAVPGFCLWCLWQHWCGPPKWHLRSVWHLSICCGHFLGEPDHADSTVLQAFPWICSCRDLGSFQNETHVPPVLSHREFIKIILEYGLILFCGDRVLTDGAISKKSGVKICLLGQIVDVQKKQHRAKSGALWCALFDRDDARSTGIHLWWQLAVCVLGSSGITGAKGELNTLPSHSRLMRP